MNTIILSPSDFIGPAQARLIGRRAEHLCNVLKVEVGHRLSVGQLNGQLGEASVTAIGADFVDVTVAHLGQPSPASLPATLILGLPRPRMLQRSLQTIATMGVQKLCLIHSARAEKSFWQTPLLKPEAIHEQLILGLEQAKATQLPIIEYCTSWREFIDQWLPGQLPQHTHKILAHPGDYPAAQPLPAGRSLIAIGPEGGFIESEVTTLSNLGFNKVSLGDRILRVETAVPVILAKLF